VIEFRVLGPLEVVDGDHLLALGSPRQRALLAVLLVHRDEPMSLDRLIDELWGERAPASAIKIVQGYVSNLRKVLGDGPLVTHGRGYVLRIPPGQLDADRFEALVAEGRRAMRDGDARTAVVRLREALALWRGPPLAEFAYESFAQSEIARLEESRLAALEERIDTDLMLGEHASLVGELEELVHEHPSHERFLGQLMLALYRSGRQADALDRYRTAGRRLVEKLGLEPGRELQELERAILVQDAALERPIRDARREPRMVARRGRRGRVLIAAGGGLLLAAFIAAAVTLAGSGAGPVRVAPNELAAIDTHSDRVTGVVPVGARPGTIAFGSGSLWVGNLDDQNISRVNPRTLRTVLAIPVVGPPTGIAVSSGGVWVVESNLNPNVAPGTSSVLVGRVDTEFNTLGRPVPIGNVVPSGPGAIAARGNSVWVAPSTGLLTHLNATTGEVVRRLNPNASPAGIALGDGAIWLSDSDANNVVRVDPTGLLTPIGVGNGPTAITVGVASGDTLTIRLLAAAPDFLSRLARPTFCAVPTNTPIKRNGVRAIPSAGPYYVQSYTPHQGVLLVRNPNYHGSRPHHFARIELKVGISTRRAVGEIEAATADYTALGLESAASTTITTLASRLAARYGPGSPAAARGGQQYFVNPGLQLDYFLLNTHRALFSHVRMRQAVNYAIDRRALAQLGDAFQPLPEPPADHYLPPGMPGYRDVRAYPTTPHVAKARKLASGGGRTAVLYTCNVSPCPDQAEIVKTNLAAIGIQVQIKTFPGETLFAREGRPSEPFDLAWGGWIPDYLDPQAMLTPILEDSSVGPTFEDRRYRRRLAAAARLSGPNRYLTYGELDLELARNAAPLAAFGNLPNDDFFSARIGCQTFGAYGMDLAALCLRHTHSDPRPTAMMDLG
jgi:DNA-binding SARP family transcriptional activator